MNRGGSWNNTARNCQSANRNRNEPGNRNNNLGLRVSRARRKLEHVRRTGQDPVPDANQVGHGANPQRPAGLVGQTARRVRRAFLWDLACSSGRSKLGPAAEMGIPMEVNV